MKLKNVLIATAFAGFTALSAQATTMQNSSNDELTKVVYACEGKKTLEVLFINTSKNSYAVINQVDEMIPMELDKSGSGALYKAMNKNYSYELFTKGDKATLFGDKGEAIISGCVNN